MSNVRVWAITFVLALVEMLHWILNGIYQPYLGTLDGGLHILGYVGGAWFIFIIGYAAYLAVDSVKPLAERYRTYISVILIFYLIASAIHMKLGGVTQSGSASYYQAYPLFLSGILAGVLTYSLATVVAVRRVSLIFLIGASTLWIIGPLVIDSMNAVEGGARGTTNYIQNLPIIGTVYMISIWIFALGLFLGLLLFFPALAVGLYFVFRSEQHRIPVFALMLSTLALSYSLVNWGGFIWD